MSQATHPDIPDLTYQKDLGIGGFASVYLYRRATPDRLVAIKVLHTTSLDDEQIKRLRDEANAMAALNHPNIAQVYSVGTTGDNRPYIEMAYYPFGTLDDQLHRDKDRLAPFSVAETLRIGVQLCAAIQTAHNLDPPLLHRDIKPANVLIDAYGNPVLTDFGIASRLTGQDGQENNISAYWAPPEAMFSTAPTDQRSDIYSLGALLWNLLTGHPPFAVADGDNRINAVMTRTRDSPLPAVGRDDVPVSFERLLAQVMGKDPHVRLATATEFAHALNTIERHEYGLAHTTAFKVKYTAETEIPDAAATNPDDRTRYRNELHGGNTGSRASPINPEQQQVHRNKFTLPLIVVAAISLALVVLIVLRFVPSTNWSANATSMSNTATARSAATSSSPRATPEEVVKEYLQAIANGDANSARNLLTPTLPGVGALRQVYLTYLTNEVLTKSLALGPITDISVTTPQNTDSGATSIEASYDIGTQHVYTTYDVTQVGGDYHVNGLVNLDLSGISNKSLAFTLNGTLLAERDTHLVILFPGTYQLDTTNPLLKVNNDTFVVTGPSEPSPSLSLEYILVDKAQALLAEAAKSRFDSCMAEKATATSCEWGYETLTNGAIANPSTVKWTVTSGNSDFSRTKFTLTDKPTIASADIKVTVRMDCKDTTGRSWHSSVTVTKVTVDFSDPDNMIVQFPWIP